jgi:hypothetical protein
MAGAAEGSFIIGGNPADEMTPQTEYVLCMCIITVPKMGDYFEKTENLL